MKIWILILFFWTFILLGFQCGDSKNERLTKDSIVSDTVKSLLTQNLRKDNTISKLTWVDSLIVNYINNSDNELLKLAKDSNITENWILDTILRDGKIFIVAEIGHDIEYRFIPDAWLFIDSLTRLDFEYDVANDSLFRWKRKKYYR